MDKDSRIRDALKSAQSAMIRISLTAHGCDYDWISDPQKLTLLESQTIEKLDAALREIDGIS